MRRYFFWSGVLAVIALILYDIKYNVHTAQNETRRLEAQLIKERQRLQMVELEWTMLIRPERIAALADKHLTLKPINSQQLMLEDAAMWRAATLNTDIKDTDSKENATPVAMQGDVLE